MGNEDHREDHDEEDDCRTNAMHTLSTLLKSAALELQNTEDESQQRPNQLDSPLSISVNAFPPTSHAHLLFINAKLEHYISSHSHYPLCF